jgi:membrane protein implicated in regulation of membrane protease activity
MATFRSFQFPQLGWRAQIGMVLAVALGLAAAGALIVVSVGLALVLLPVVAIALFIGRWRLRRMMADAQKRWDEQQQSRSSYIETQYVVVDDDEKDRPRR